MADSPIDWLARVDALRTWSRRGERAPHKPLLLLFALGRLQRGEPADIPFRDAAAPLAALLREYGPARRQHHPELPFYHLRSDRLWTLSADPTGSVGVGTALRGRLLAANVVGRLDPAFAAALQADPRLFSAVVRHILERNFPPSLHEDLCAAVGLELEALEIRRVVARTRSPEFRQAVLLAYEFRCAICGYDGQLGGQFVGLDAAHVHWWAGGGEDSVANGVCLCSLHHKLLDRGVIGLTGDRRVQVSMYFVGRSNAVQEMVLRYAGKPLLTPQPGQPVVRPASITWHSAQVFRAPARMGEVG